MYRNQCGCLLRCEHELSKSNSCMRPLISLLLLSGAVGHVAESAVGCCLLLFVCIVRSGSPCARPLPAGAFCCLSIARAGSLLPCGVECCLLLLCWTVASLLLCALAPCACPHSHPHSPSTPQTHVCTHRGGDATFCQLSSRAHCDSADPERHLPTHTRTLTLNTCLHERSWLCSLYKSSSCSLYSFTCRGGDATFCQLSRRLAFGAECPASAAGRIATVQTLSGTGALRVGAEFLKKHYAVKVVYLPDPTW